MGWLGIGVFMALGWAFSRDRKAIHWPTVLWALALQGLIAVVVLKGALLARILSFIPFPRGTGWGVAALAASPAVFSRFPDQELRRVKWAVAGLALLAVLRGNLVGAGFDALRLGVVNLMGFAQQGAAFVFGPLADPRGAPVLDARGAPAGALGLVFAFVVLPTIIFVASLFAILYHLGIMQRVIGLFARAFRTFLRVSGAESVSVAASILMGQTEAPLTIRPFLARLTRSELMVVMTAGMAHVSGAVMVAYVQVAGVDVAHLLTAVIMTAPGAVLMAKLLEPETERPATAGQLPVVLPRTDANVLDAAVRGAGEGLQLAFNVAGMLVAFVALVALVNGLLRLAHPALSLEHILGVLFRPFALLMGVPWRETAQVGALLGKRMVVNEFMTFMDLGRTALDARARLIATFALCGFANFSSIAIQVGGIGALVPERRGDLARLGVKAMLAGTLANAMSACIAGILG
ncbi:MAG: nucleoside transporter C-terminal domain-containing protein [Holophaga sp.]